jgi:disulfide bond formation protein DsbB
MTESVKPICLFLAWLLCLIATIVTLYSSYFLNIPPCPLCWFQRCCLYPLVIILGIAAYRADSSIVPYVFLLPLISSLLALYQYLEQMIPGFSPIQLCTATGPQCSTIHFQWLGFITYPFISMIASLTLLFLLFLAYRTKK